MTRWTLLAIACAVAACGDGERDQLSRDASDAAAGADSALRTAADSPDMAAGDADAGDADTRGGMGADTGPAAAGAVEGGTGGVTGARAMGGVPAAPSTAARGTPAATARLDLSADQVRRLQSALNDAGCDAGTVDGVIGRRTRQAITCGLERNNLESDDMNGLYRALDLDF